jgi:hypothetical protein
MPGDCVSAAGGTVRCNIQRTVTLPGRNSTTHTITESTEITIGKVAAGSAKP